MTESTVTGAVTGQATTRGLVTRTDAVLRPDPTRVVTRMFLPGQEMLIHGSSRATSVLDRVMALTDEQVDRALGHALAEFEDRHQDLAGTFEERFRLIAHRLVEPESISEQRRLLIGAYFSQEYSVESAALFNPSMVVHPDQSGVPSGTTRFLMSVRAVGEGHISSIEFRTGTIDATDRLLFDEPGRPLVQPVPRPALLSKAQFVHQLGHRAADGDDAVRYVLDELPEAFDRRALDAAMATLRGQRLTRGPGRRARERLESIADSQYTVEFPAGLQVSQRVLMPGGPAESHGLEDLRLVRFIEADGSATYRGTYTAFDGRTVTPALITTTDFLTFHSQQAIGPAAQNKGMALFPRAVGGRFLALSRWDRETSSLAESTDMWHWEVGPTLQLPKNPWEIVQVGNCGSPLETPEGWLVLTHGVGPVRQYGIGAMLLDLDDPTIVRGSLAEPLLTPTADEREGYVPNVVYSCGSMLHGDTLVLPYGCSDSSIRVALLDLEGLLGKLLRQG
ncbi:MAG TPA: glycoside hydrolase family 130 protein [Candidatus Limnocylindrales bacterium]|nr:glycoside hydrolase family 130 protein [Candidatus Limnocylindrales bacterium]